MAAGGLPARLHLAARFCGPFDRENAIPLASEPVVVDEEFLELLAERFSEVIDVNVKGAANVIRHFAPSMVKRKTGVIVNLSSGWGRSTDAEVAPYCASKWGIEGLTQALAQELPSGLAAIALNPGIINTEMLQSCFGSSAASYPSPAKWAQTAVPFLLKVQPPDNGKQMEVPGIPKD